MMRYLSVCSGIEAASVAWHPLGWTPLAVSEIEPFPCSVLAHHWPHVPNLGDMTAITQETLHGLGPIDLLVGGTPCQSFSVAGLRKGMDDPRGNLALVYLRLASLARPRWLLWENVPGALSSTSGHPASAPPDRVGVGPGEQVVDEEEYDEGGDLACFLAALGQLGYGWAYRVLDAQYVRVDGLGRAVPQRRRRLFVVGHLGDWSRAAAVLLEPESVRWHSPPRRAPRQAAAHDVAPCIGASVETSRHLDGSECVVSASVTSKWAKGSGGPAGDEAQNLVAATLTQGVVSNGKGGYAGRRREDDENIVAHSLRADGFDASEDGTGRGTPLVFQPRFARNGRGAPDDVAHPLTAEAGRTGKGDSAQCVAFAIQERAVCESDAGPDGAGFREGAGYTLEARQTPQAVAFSLKHDQEPKFSEGVCHTMQACNGGSGVSSVACETIADAPLFGGLRGYAVRRLTPRECERLQGFPDDYTLVPHRGKPAADGPRYRALGNSMAVNVMRWLGRRIEWVEALAP